VVVLSDLAPRDDPIGISISDFQLRTAYSNRLAGDQKLPPSGFAEARSYEIAIFPSLSGEHLLNLFFALVRLIQIGLG
jgi:hypothetical protein